MLVSEFIDRTGYQPTAEEYEKIEERYNASSMDKDLFCAVWCKKNPDLAGQLDRLCKKREYVSGQEDKTIARVQRHIWKRTNHGEKLTREQFADLISGLDKEIACDTIRKMKDWRGITQNWQGSVWNNYWQIFECVVYGY